MDPMHSHDPAHCFSTFAPGLHGHCRERGQRQQIVQFWLDLMASSLEQLKGRPHPDFSLVESELRRLVEDPRAVIDYQARQLLARKPSQSSGGAGALSSQYF